MLSTTWDLLDAPYHIRYRVTMSGRSIGRNYNPLGAFIEPGKRRLRRACSPVAARGQKADLTEARKVTSSHPGERERFPGIDSDPGRFPGTRCPGLYRRR